MLLQITIHDIVNRKTIFTHEFDPHDKEPIDMNTKQLEKSIKDIGIVDDMQFALEERMLLEI